MQTIVINNILIANGNGVASIDKLDADNIKYVTCLKLKYPTKNLFLSPYVERYFKNSHKIAPF